MISDTLPIKTLPLEAGGHLEDVRLHYHVRGKLDGSRPLVWVFHALTANSNPEQWWAGLFTSSGFYAGHDVVCANVLASPYGSSSPLSHGGMDFPLVSVRDTVRAQLLLASHLGLKRIDTLLGGSFGGYQALEFAYGFEGAIDHLVLLATGARELPWNKAIHEAMRLALSADPTLGKNGGGQAGLKAARAVGMLNYRTSEQFNQSQADEEVLGEYEAPSYMRYHGQKLVDRFDAACYYKLLDQLDTHDLGRGRGGCEAALEKIDVPALVLSIDSDVLIPPGVQEELAAGLPQSSLKMITSAYGHDGFLLEFEQINTALKAFYNE